MSCQKEKEVLTLSHCSHLADILDLNIHTSPMVMRSKKAINTFNSKMFKLQVYLLRPCRSCGGRTTLSSCGKHKKR
jgi:hypothetical protein